MSDLRRVLGYSAQRPSAPGRRIGGSPTFPAFSRSLLLCRVFARACCSLPRWPA